MARDAFAACLAAVLRHEGGFVHHPRDPGGATNFGITRQTLARWRRHPASVRDVRLLSRAEAGEIYRSHYWQPIHGEELPCGIDLAVFDFAVNSGTGRAVRALQGSVGEVADGRIGPRTLAAIAAVDARRLVTDLSKRRLAFLMGLPTWPVFGRGWRARVATLERQALAMAGVQPSFSAGASA